MMRSLAALVMIVALAPRAHAAAKSVTLIAISGAGGGPVTDRLEESLGDLYLVVPAEVYQRTAQRLELGGDSVEAVQAVATRLRIDAVIDGSIVVQGRARQLLVAVHAGSSGRVIARGRYDLVGRALPVVCERVLADLVRALEHVAPAAPAAARPRAPETVTVVHHQESDDDDDSAPPRPAPPQARKPPAPATTPRHKEPDDDDDDSAPAPPPPRPARPSPPPVTEED